MLYYQGRFAGTGECLSLSVLLSVPRWKQETGNQFAFNAAAVKKEGYAIARTSGRIVILCLKAEVRKENIT